MFNGEDNKTHKKYTLAVKNKTDDCFVKKDWLILLSLSQLLLFLVNTMLIESLKDIEIEYKYEVYDIPEIIYHANDTLEPTGTLACDKANNFCYLKISDQYIYETYRLFREKNPNIEINIPDYFTDRKNNIGAHISLTYPDENNAKLVKQYIEASDSFKIIAFNINEVFSLSIFNKTLYALTVTCTELDHIRKIFGLSKKLDYHGLLVPFHITFAISRN